MLWFPMRKDKPSSQWPSFIQFGMPYLEALLQIKTCNDVYGLETADDIVIRFLCNVQAWRGADARRIKAELNQHYEEYKRVRNRG